MASDYLFCGSCFLNFRLSDINLFIEHKKNNCVTSYLPGFPSESNTGHGSNYSTSTGNLVANLLECVQCLRRFPTAWPLLMHVQFEHQLLFASAVRQQTELQQPTSSSPDPLNSAGSYETLDNTRDSGYPVSLSSINNNNSTSWSSGTPMMRSSTMEAGIRQLRVNTTGTQTVLSSFRNGLNIRRKRSYPSCCVPVQPDLESNLLNDGEESQTKYICTGLATPMCCPCPPSVRCPPSSDPSRQSCGCLVPAVCNCRPMLNTSSCTLTSGSDSCCNNASCTVDTTLAIENGSNQKIDGTNDQITSPTVAGSYCNSSQAIPVSSMRSCCPCPTIIKQPPTSSSGSQTEFEPGFSSPDYVDIAMLLASPSKSTPDMDNVLDFGESNRVTTDSPSGVEPSSMDHHLLSTVASSSVSLLTPNISLAQSPVELPHSVIDLSSNMMNHVKTAMSCGGTEFGLHSVQSTNVTIQPLEIRVASSLPTSRVHDPNPIQTQFVCSQCGQVYRQKIHLRKHIMIHHLRKKPYECALCTYATVEKSHLTVHVRTHTGERPFQCRSCEYSSTQNCTLKAHYMRKHPTSLIYCSLCNERFYTELELSKHERTCYFTGL